MTEDIEPHYRGEVLNCIRNGKGSYKYEIGGNGLFIYDGQWSQGHKKGSGGKFTMKGIHQVTGDFSDGEITGHGVKTWSDGRRYEGGWLNGEMDGKGDWISSDGDEMYSGSFKDNKREGFGVLVFNRPSSIHRGCFSLNRKNGFGTYLCPNSVYIEGNFVDNLIQGTVKVNWQKMANLVGHCSDGLFDGSCYYCTADGCYQFDGLFAKGFPVPSLEATYVYLDIDRSDVVMKVSEDVVPVTITPRKKTPTTVKKSKVVDIVDIQLLQVQVGFELGKVIIRAGTQIDIDDRKRRAEMLAEAALLVSSAATSKTSKAAKISTTVAQDLDMIDANYPSPSGGKHTLPEELQRNVIVRIRSVISGEPDLESAFAGTSTLSSTSKSANKMAAAITERILSPDSYGPPIMFWLRKPSLDKFSDCYERFPLTSFTYIGGVKRTPVDFTSEEGDVRVKVESRETFTAATSAHLITVSKNPSKGDMILTSHELISPSKYLPSLEDSSSNALIIEPSITFTVPYTEIRGAANSVSFIIDFTLNEKLLLDSYMALTLNDRHGSTEFTESNIRSSDFVLVPVLNVMKDGIDVDNHSPKISSIEHGISEVLQLVLMIPSKHFVQAALYKRAAEELACQQKEIVRLASEALEITKLQRQASLSDAAINVAAAATTIGSPKPRKSTPTKKKSLPKVEKDKEASTASKSAVGSPNIPEKMELNETTTADNVPAVEWTDCFWQLSVITTTNEIISPKSLSTAALRDEVGLRDPLFANSVSTGSITRGVDESSSSKTHVQPVQRWGCGTFNSSAWHSLALTARLSAEEKSSIDMVNGTGDGEMGEKHSASKEQRVLLTSPSLELVLDGHGLLPAKLNGESTVASSVAHTSSWLMSDNVHMNDVPKALCAGGSRINYFKCNFSNYLLF